jgi:hypothetical protein
MGNNYFNRRLTRGGTMSANIEGANQDPGGLAIVPGTVVHQISPMIS